ncbi:putative pentatricopeptide repeat-containing protein [Forsythia ovata]|uniref:Pentatricopeptide repeat-containing protein n=1 Tax=Forsythia ovata TaxID=205694 RepID=A0ABD1VNB0_9LAMI
MVLLHLLHGHLFFKPPILLRFPKFCFPCTSIYALCKSHFLISSYASSLAPSNSCNRPDFLDHLLQLCINGGYDFHHVKPVKQIHAQLLVTASLFSAFLSARLITVYSKMCLLSEARKVFTNAPEDCFSNSLFWNSILRANISAFEYSKTLELYFRMCALGFQPDGFGFPLVIRACAMKGGVTLCKIVHCHVLQMGFGNNLHVSNELLRMYGKIGQMDIACQLFDRMPVRTHVSWNTMVSGFASNFDCDRAYWMFSRMENEGLEPNAVTWTSLLSSFARCGFEDKTWTFYVLMREKMVNATAESLAVVISVCADSDFNGFQKGEVVHAYVMTGGFDNYVFVRNSLIHMYGKNGAIEEAEYLLSRLESKSIVSWNALISSYAESGLCDVAFSVFLQMENLDADSVVRPNVVSWSAVINGFAAKGRHKESLELFRRMQFDSVLANAITIATMLSVCAELSALHLGREIHAHAIRFFMNSDILVRNGLINMYMKCGSLRAGGLVFEGMDCKDIFSWNTMITGFGMHGHSDSALKTFYQMVNARVKPDEVTFVAVLSACSHTGLVTEGRDIFYQMNRDFQIEPQVEHYACMVDLFGRAGLLQEAISILKTMPMEPNACVWGALLNSCKMHKNSDVAEETASQIFNLNSEVTGSYMLLSNLYAASGRWEDSARVRVSAKTRGLKKIPGESWIEVKNKVHTFSAGKALNSRVEELYSVLKDMKLHMAMEGYVSNKILGPQTADEEEYA